MPLYKDQPVFWEIDKELRQQGLLPHTFTAIKRWPLSPYSHPQHNLIPVNQLLEADVVYVRDFVKSELMSDEQIRQLALIAHHCYASHDLVTKCLSTLETRGVLSSKSLNAYRRHIFLDYRLEDEPPTVNYSVSFSV
jgi:hypothetical protein